MSDRLRILSCVPTRPSKCNSLFQFLAFKIWFPYVLNNVQDSTKYSHVAQISLQALFKKMKKLIGEEENIMHRK